MAPGGGSPVPNAEPRPRRTRGCQVCEVRASIVSLFEGRPEASRRQVRDDGTGRRRGGVSDGQSLDDDVLDEWDDSDARQTTAWVLPVSQDDAALGRGRARGAALARRLLWWEQPSAASGTPRDHRSGAFGPARCFAAWKLGARSESPLRAVDETGNDTAARLGRRVDGKEIVR